MTYYVSVARINPTHSPFALLNTLNNFFTDFTSLINTVINDVC